MSLEVAAHEAGQVRVFALSMTDNEARALKANAATDGVAPLAAALGLETVDDTHVEVFALKDLGDMALADYLIEGGGVETTQVVPDRGKLAALEGWVMVVYSSAFGSAEVTIEPATSLTLIGTYAQEGVDWRAPVDLSTPSARPNTPEDAGDEEPKRPSNAAMSGRIATLALLLAFALVALMVWVAA